MDRPRCFQPHHSWLASVLRSSRRLQREDEKTPQNFLTIPWLWRCCFRRVFPMYKVGSRSSSVAAAHSSVSSSVRSCHSPVYFSIASLPPFCHEGRFGSRRLPLGGTLRCTRNIRGCCHTVLFLATSVLFCSVLLLFLVSSRRSAVACTWRSGHGKVALIEILGGQGRGLW